MAAIVSEKIVDPAPASAPPVLQSMGSHNPPERFSRDSPSSSPAPEARDRSRSSTPSPSRQVDPQVSVEFQLYFLLLLNFDDGRLLQRKKGKVRVL